MVVPAPAINQPLKTIEGTPNNFEGHSHLPMLR